MISRVIHQVFPAILICCLWVGCSRPASTQEETGERKILFLGHPYQYGPPGNRVDTRIESLDLSLYDELWLGGDLCSETTAEEATLDYLDDLFDLSNPNTHWSLGNHDLRNGHRDWIEKRTHWPVYQGYTVTSQRLTRLVLNTNLSGPQVAPVPGDTALAEAQWNLITSVTDTISQSSHLIVMMHHVVLGDVDWEMNTAGGANKDLKTYSFSADSGTTFADSLYPRLVEVQQRGVQVIVLAGDFGKRSKSFYWPTREGVVFLGSGINNSILNIDTPEQAGSVAPDRVIVFYHDPKERTLRWEFPTLDGLRLHGP